MTKAEQRLPAAGVGGSHPKEHRGTLGVDGGVLGLGCGGSYATEHIGQNLLNCVPKKGGFT